MCFINLYVSVFKTHRDFSQRLFPHGLSLFRRGGRVWTRLYRTGKLLHLETNGLVNQHRVYNVVLLLLMYTEFICKWVYTFCSGVSELVALLNTTTKRPNTCPISKRLCDLYCHVLPSTWNTIVFVNSQPKPSITLTIVIRKCAFSQYGDDFTSHSSI